MKEYYLIFKIMFPSDIYWHGSMLITLIENSNWKGYIDPKFTAALFTIAKTWKQPKCSLTGEWIKKMWYICTMAYYSFIKKNETVPFAATWMGLEIIILSGVSQRKANIIWYLLHEKSKKVCVLCLVMSDSFQPHQGYSPWGWKESDMGFSRQEYWVTISSSRGSAWPRDRTSVSCTAGSFFTTEPPRKPP